MIRKDIIDLFQVPAGKTIKLKDYHPGWAQSDEFEELGKESLQERHQQILDENLANLTQAQEKLYADNGMGADHPAGDGRRRQGRHDQARHVRVNPQGCQVFSFKKPSAEELDHNFLWRYMRCLPERGSIGIFNRSYYEDVLVVRVHPEILAAQRLPGARARRSSGGGVPGHQRIRASPGPQRHGDPQVLPECLEGGAEAAVPRTARKAGQALEVLLGRPRRAGNWGQYMKAYGMPVGDQHEVGPLVRHPGRPQVGRQSRRRRRDHHNAAFARPEIPRGDRRQRAALAAAKQRLLSE